MYEANRRVGTHATKTRAEVAGSKKKPWRQKGTGRARAGSKKSPLWKGGGVVFGPQPRDYSYAIHRKQRQVAIRSALLSKFLDGQVVVVEDLDLDVPKTKKVHQILKAIGVEGKCLIGTDAHNKNLAMAARNIPGVLVSPVSEFNARDVVRMPSVVLTRKAFDSLVAAPAVAADAGKADGTT